MCWFTFAFCSITSFHLVIPEMERDEAPENSAQITYPEYQKNAWAKRGGLNQAFNSELSMEKVSLGIRW